LEDPLSRFQFRMHESDPNPDLGRLNENLHVSFQWPKLKDGGLQGIVQWVEQMKRPTSTK
jgi:hypothetical protein